MPVRRRWRRPQWPRSDDDAQHPPVEPEPAASATRQRVRAARDELRELSGRLDDVLTSYSLPLQPVEPGDAVCGPNTVRFRVRMARGGTIAQVEARERDIMRELGSTKPIMIGQDAGSSRSMCRARPGHRDFGDLAPSLARRGTSRAASFPVMFGVDLAGEPGSRISRSSRTSSSREAPARARAFSSHRFSDRL